MNDKKVIENYRSIRDVERLQPQPLRTEDLSYIQNMIQNAWENRSSIIRETRSLSEIVDAIESDKSKSRERKDLELRIAKIADRIRDHLEPKSEPLHLECESTNVTVSDELPLHERIRFLRKQKS
jgi:hypothetical protein